MPDAQPTAPHRKRALREGWLGPLQVETWGWLLFKVVLGLGWGTGMLMFTPQTITDNISGIALLWWCISTIVGAVLSIIGMVVASRRFCNPVLGLRGLTVELIGIVIFAGGPLQYLIIQWSLIRFGDADTLQDRYALAWFAAAMFVVILIRCWQIGFTFYREATNPYKREVRSR